MKQIDESVIDALSGDLKKTVSKTGFTRLAMGISGGLDSAVSAALAIRAVGKENIFPFFLPYKDSNPASREDAVLVADKFGLTVEEIDITALAQPYLEQFTWISPIRLGNLLSRLRMAVIFDQSMLHNALVLGTGNKSEILLGYMTWFGDSACSINPLGDLYKTQVRQAAHLLGVPERIIQKAPSADHFMGQTDEDDLGHSYESIDNLLHNFIEEGISADSLIESGMDADFVREIERRVSVNTFKRRLPVVISIGQVSI